MSLTEEPVRRLKVSHHVQPPPAASRKKVHVQQQLKHIHLNHAAGFSSDEEEPEQDGADEDPKAAEKLDPSDLTDAGLRAMLLKYGVKPGPIVASTRALYERRLRTLLQSAGREELNEAEIVILYSDSEEDDDETTEEEEDKASDSEQDDQETAEVLDQTKAPSSKRADPSRNKEPRSKWSSKNALKPSERTQTLCSQIPAGISKTSSTRLRTGMEIRRSLSASSDKELNSRSILEQRSWSSRINMQLEDEFRPVDRQLYHTPKSSPQQELSQKPIDDVLKDLFPNTKATPTGLYAAPRRPIKGAAGRPVQLAYPDTPVSPSTQERREVERRLVPVYIQILVFFMVVCILYFIYVNVGDSSYGWALLESLTQWSEGEEGVLFHAEAQDSQSDSGQDKLF